MFQKINSFNIAFLLLSLVLLHLVGMEVFASDKNVQNSELYKQARAIEQEDAFKAFSIYQDLARQGHVEAKVRLSALLQAGLGEGTKKERVEYSISLLKEAAA